jgi:hypothetical protein
MKEKVAIIIYDLISKEVISVEPVSACPSG